jgi:hypothetical protein
MHGQRAPESKPRAPACHLEFDFPFGFATGLEFSLLGFEVFLDFVIVVVRTRINCLARETFRDR